MTSKIFPLALAGAMMLFLRNDVGAQTIAELQAALRSSNRTVQAIHKYPPEVKGGGCHFVPVTSVTVNGNKVTITETWSLFGFAGKTVLEGVLEGNVVQGKWSSNYSKGNWRYDQSTGKGEWNKPEGKGTFTSFEYLLFRIVPKDEVRDEADEDCR